MKTRANELLLTTLEPGFMEELFPHYFQNHGPTKLVDTMKNNMHRLDTLAQTVKKHSDCKDISKLKDSLKDLVTLAGNLWKEIDKAGDLK